MLLIACANVANLLLARSALRGAEISLRLAVGAGRWRLIRQLLTESLLLGFIGGLGGVILGALGLKFLLRVQPGNLPRLQDVHLDGRVLGFALLVSLATGLIFGLVPALQATRMDLNESLKEEGRGMTAGQRRHRLRSGLVIAEIALSLILFVDAGLMVRSFIRVNSEPPGYQTSHLLAVDIGLPGTKYRNVQEQAAFLDELLERTAHTGIEPGGGLDLPERSQRLIAVVLMADAQPAGGTGSAAYRQISHNYFHTMNSLIRGVSSRNRIGTHLGACRGNETFARTFPKGEAGRAHSERWRPESL